MLQVKLRPFKKGMLIVDIDDCLSKFIPALMAYSDANFGSVDSLVRYEGNETYAKLWSLEGEDGQEQLKQRYVAFIKDGGYHKLQVVDGAYHALKTIKDAGYEVGILTSRVRLLEDMTRKWLDGNFPGIFSEDKLFFSDNWEDIDGENHKMNKGEILRKIGADWFIDDMTKHVNASVENGINTIQFGDYAWEKSSKTDERVIQCKRWSDIIDAMLPYYRLGSVVRKMA